MTFRLTSALCILALAGCTSSEPQNASYAPVVEQAAPMPMPPPPPAAALQGQPSQFPVNGVAAAAPPPALAVQGQSGQVPGTGIAAATPGCHTVDDVTLCDVPADPSVDETHYTN